MSTVSLLTKNIWSELTKAVKVGKSKSIVAVAYFGQNGASMLPLTKGSVLVVDASLKALKTGQTCPHELLKLYYKGVHIYSKENLHAKLFILGNNLYCGSTNVSGRSANHLHEALIKTSDKVAIADAKEFIHSLCRMELGEEEIKGLNKYYNPPKVFGGKTNIEVSDGEFHICKLDVADWSEGEQAQVEIGRALAENNRIKKSRHFVDEFLWAGEMSFKKGDTILQIVNEGDKTYVSPPGKLIHVRKWSNGKKTKYCCYLEMPDKRRKNLELVKRQLSEIDSRAIDRQGKKNLELEVVLKSLWR